MMRSSFRRPLFSLTGALLFTGCADSTSPDPAQSTSVLAVIQCTGTRAGIRCEPGSVPAGISASVQPTLNRIVGGQNLYVRLTSTGTTFNSSTNQLSSTVSVRNLTDQALGTADGTTLDPDAVRVFFHSGPTDGVTVANADGEGSFTGSHQPYFRYNEIIPAGAVNVNAKTWIFQVAATTTTFSFSVYVTGRQPNESAPVGVAGLDVTQVASGLTNPVFLTAPAGDSRLFVVEQSGQIRIIKNGTLLTTPFLNIASRISYGGERGLLSLAFDPLYATNGLFYVYLTDPTGDIAIERYGSTPGADVADATPTRMATITHRTYGNHNGGLAMFGTDGRLYFGTGDGGSGGDPDNNAQNPGSMLGKLLRLDVRTTPYTPEIWAIGLRNPWRFDFRTVSPTRTDLYIADVGQNAYEEIDVVANNPSGLNYGWRVQEGMHCYPSLASCANPAFVQPVLEYDHGQGCSITGGFVYRGAAIPWLTGQYLYSDYCSGFLRSISGDPLTGFSEQRWTIPAVGNVLSFGEDSAGEMYMLTAAGVVWRIIEK